MGSEVDEPASLAALWQIHGQQRREIRPGLTLESIIAAAIEIADEQGLHALSMAGLGRRLGYTAMALYRHVPNKAVLLMFMTDAALGVPPSSLLDGRAWRPGLELWARHVAARYQEHPWLLEVPVPRLLAMPNQVAWMEAALTSLKHTSLRSEDKGAVLVLLAGFVRGWKHMMIELGGGGVPTGEAPRLVTSNLGAVLRHYVLPERYPETMAMIADGVFDNDGGNEGDDFEFGLARVLDGIEAYIAASTRKQ